MTSIEEVQAKLEKVEANLKNDPSTITLLICLEQLRMFILLIIVKLANIKLQQKEQSLQKDKESLQKDKESLQKKEQTLLDIQLELIKKDRKMKLKELLQVELYQQFSNSQAQVIEEENKSLESSESGIERGSSDSKNSAKRSMRSSRGTKTSASRHYNLIEDNILAWPTMHIDGLPCESDQLVNLLLKKLDKLDSNKEYHYKPYQYEGEPINTANVERDVEILFIGILNEVFAHRIFKAEKKLFKSGKSEKCNFRGDIAWEKTYNVDNDLNEFMIEMKTRSTLVITDKDKSDLVQILFDEKKFKQEEELIRQNGSNLAQIEVKNKINQLHTKRKAVNIIYLQIFRLLLE